MRGRRVRRHRVRQLLCCSRPTTARLHTVMPCLRRMVLPPDPFCMTPATFRSHWPLSCLWGIHAQSVGSTGLRMLSSAHALSIIRRIVV